MMKIGYACINMELGGSCDKTFQQTGKRCGLCHKCLGGKAKSKVIQNVGRVLRLFANKKESIIYDFQDAGANYLEEHAIARRDVYNEYYGDI